MLSRKKLCSDRIYGIRIIESGYSDSSMKPEYLHFMIGTIPRNRIPFRRKQIKIMKNVIAIIKNAWGDSPPPKVKTGFILNIIGLTAFLCLSGATAHAQSDKQIINMDNQ